MVVVRYIVLLADRLSWGADVSDTRVRTAYLRKSQADNFLSRARIKVIGTEIHLVVRST